MNDDARLKSSLGPLVVEYLRLQTYNQMRRESIILSRPLFVYPVPCKSESNTSENIYAYLYCVSFNRLGF